MFKHYFEGIQHIEIGPLISLVVFFIFFVIMMWMVLRSDKKFIHRMKNLPLDDNEMTPDENEK